MKRLNRIPDLKDIPNTFLSKEYIDNLMADLLSSPTPLPDAWWEWHPPEAPTIVDGVTLVEDE